MARDFDGTADYLLASVSPVTALPVTLACWLQSDQTAADQVVMSIGDSGANNRVQIVYAGSGTDTIQAASVTTAAAVGSSLSGTTPGTGVWMHAGAVFVNTASRFAYLDGVAGAENTSTRDPGAASWDYVALAARNSTSIGGFFNGKVAEAAIWNADLTAAEMAQLAAGFSPIMVRPQSLVFYAPLFGRNGAAGDEEDWAGGLSLAQTSSPALFDHPRIIYPRKRIWTPKAAAVGGGFKAAWARGANSLIGVQT